MSYSNWTATSTTYATYEAASARCASTFVANTGTDVVEQFGHSVEFWRIGGQTLQIRECEWLMTSRSPGSVREGNTNKPRFTAARARAIAKLGATDTEAAAIIAWHLAAAKTAHSDDPTGWEAYRTHTRDRMHDIRNANK